MKVNIVSAIGSLIVAGLFAYLLYSIGQSENQLMATIFGFLVVGTILAGMIAVKLPDDRHSTNLRLVSSVFIVIALAFFLIAVPCGIGVPFLIIFSGLIWTLYVLAAYTIAKMNM